MARCVTCTTATTAPKPTNCSASKSTPSSPRNKMKLRIFFLLTLAAGALGLSGCATTPQLVRVKPWERATLTDYTMRPDRDPLYTAFTEHTYFSRETAAGGRGVGGSGCGCN